MMTHASALTMALGGFLGAGATMAGLTFRRSAAPTWVRMALPLQLAACACAVPMTLWHLMGYPAAVRLSDLPERAELVAFFPLDDADNGLVDLWLSADGAPPRSYEVRADRPTREMLRQAQLNASMGRPTRVARRDVTVIHSGLFWKYLTEETSSVVLDDAVRPALPPK